MKIPNRCPMCGRRSWRCIDVYHSGYSFGSWKAKISERKIRIERPEKNDTANTRADDEGSGGGLLRLEHFRETNRAV